MSPGDLSELPDDALLARARSGDFEGFCVLFRRHREAALLRAGSREALLAAFAALHASLLRWDARDTWLGALERAIARAPGPGRRPARRRSEPGPPPDEETWDALENSLRSRIGAAPLRRPFWLAVERFAVSRRGRPLAALLGVAVVLAVGAYASLPAYRTVPLPPYATTVLPVAALTATFAAGLAPEPAGPASGAGVPQSDRVRALPSALHAGSVAPARFQVILEAPSDVNAIVTAPDGEAVRTLAGGHYPAGSHVLTWDCRDRMGRPVRAGSYVLQVTTDRWGERRTFAVAP